MRSRAPRDVAMDPEFWHSRWREGRIGFHEPAVNARLTSHWSALELEPRAPVFVPLCGKSLDLEWLAERGHPVLGVELSELALRAWFEERGIEPRVEDAGAFRRFVHGDVTLLAGDVFDLGPGDLEGVRGVWDRAALVALPEPSRRAYAQHLAALLEPGARLLLVTLEYDTERMSGPPFAVPDDEVATLFGERFERRLLAAEAGPQVVGGLAGRGLETLREAVFALERR